MIRSFSTCLLSLVVACLCSTVHAGGMMKPPDAAAAAPAMSGGVGGVGAGGEPVKKGGILARRKAAKDQAKQEAEKYLELRRQGVDEVSHTAEAAAMRDFKLRKKKRKGLIRKRNVDLATVLFPGVSPEEYAPGENIFPVTDLVHSKKTHIPFEFYDLPICEQPFRINRKDKKTKVNVRKNLGARLQGIEQQPSPYEMTIKRSHTCRPACVIKIGSNKVRWMRNLVSTQYRIQLSLDQLPVLMRSKELNYAVKGYPIGFKAPPTYTGLSHEEFYLYNHLTFTITYKEDPSQFEGIRITGFDVHPVSIKHDTKQVATKLSGDKKAIFKPVDVKSETVSTCNGPEITSPESDVNNDPTTYLPLRMGETGEDMVVLYSYSVEWVESSLPWSDRWDVYIIGSHDDDVHFFAIVNSLMIVLFLTGAIATIMIRTLKQDIAGYNEMQTLEEAQEETGWKLVHGDVFRPPSRNPMLFSVLVGTGAQLGMAFFCSMICAILKWLNPLKKGQTLTAIIILYVLCGSVSGFVSSRLYKFCEGKAWKQNTVLTAAGLPGLLVCIFMVLNVWLTIVGAATALSFFSIFAIFSLWLCVATPLVFVGAFFGLKFDKLEVPTKTNQIARIIPDLPWYATPPMSFLLGGVLPFGSVCIELFFIMSALWLHQIYYVMGFLLAVFVILMATCSEVAIVMCYLQLCVEDHRWWWKSFLNCAAAGVYIFLYSVWFLISRLELVGILPVVVYLTYMTMLSIVFGIFCGAVGVITCFYFNTKIYGALKVD